MQKEEKEKKERNYLYFVDGEKFDSDEATITGMVIKVKLPEPKRGYGLYLEGDGNNPDELINDETSVSLEKGAKHFYTVPPATFGSL